MDLLIIGPGRLGKLIAGKWREAHPTAGINLLFRSENPERTAELTGRGFTVLSPHDQDLKCPYVVFCAPPTGNENYVKDVNQGLSRVTSPDSGLYVFTSSGSVFTENSGGEVDESSETAKLPTGNSTKLIDSEESVIAQKGCVIRLGGLYSSDIGAHNYWGRGGEFNSKPGGLINLVNYEDAAEAVVAALRQPQLARGELFLVSDGSPLSRQEIAQATVTSSSYRDKGIEVNFVGGEGVDGKRYNTRKVREVLGWTPRHASFASFIAEL